RTASPTRRERPGSRGARPPYLGGAFPCPSAKAREQHLPRLVVARHRSLLDRSEAAHLLRKRCNLDGEIESRIVEPALELVEKFLVLANQPALHAPLARVAERVQARAPQTLQPREDFEHPEHPAAELVLPRPPGIGIDPREERRRKMESELEVLAETTPEAREKLGSRVEPRDLVLVLVREQLEIGPGDGVRQRAAAGPNAPLERLDALDAATIAVRIG